MKWLNMDSGALELLRRGKTLIWQQLEALYSLLKLKPLTSRGIGTTTALISENNPWHQPGATTSQEKDTPMEFHELQQIVESNSRAIQSLTDAIIEDREQAREERQELRQAMIGIANLLSSLDSDRPTILRKLNTIENKVDRILERGDQVQS